MGMQLEKSESGGLTRRGFLKGVAVLTGATALAACNRNPESDTQSVPANTPPPTEAPVLESNLHEAIKNEGGMLIEEKGHSISVSQDSLGVELSNGEALPYTIREGATVNIGNISTKFSYSSEVFPEIAFLNVRPAERNEYGIGDIYPEFIPLPKDESVGRSITLKQYTLPIHGEGSGNIVVDKWNKYGVVPVMSGPAAGIYPPQVYQGEDGKWKAYGEVGKTVDIDSNNPMGLNKGSWSFALCRISPHPDEAGDYKMEYLGIVDNTQSKIFATEAEKLYSEN